jgi:hypothetical protein
MTMEGGGSLASSRRCLSIYQSAVCGFHGLRAVGPIRSICEPLGNSAPEGGGGTFYRLSIDVSRSAVHLLINSYHTVVRFLINL